MVTTKQATVRVQVAAEVEERLVDMWEEHVSSDNYPNRTEKEKG